MFVSRHLLLLALLASNKVAADCDDDIDSDDICDADDSCREDPNNDLDGDGVCTMCCGGYLGPNGGNNGEYEIQVDMSGVAPGVVGTASSGVYTLSAKIYVTENWDGTSQLLHARAWDSSSSVIGAISGDGAAGSEATRGEWTWVSTEFDMGSSVPNRMSVYFGYPMQNTNGWVLLDELLVTDENGLQFVPNDGYVSCERGFFEGSFHGVGDSYGNYGWMPGACDYEGFSMGNLNNCNDEDSDGICSPVDSCQGDPDNDVDGDGSCIDIYQDIAANLEGVEANRVTSNRNAADIAQNTAEIATNAADISSIASTIGDNADAISSNADAISAMEDAAHIVEVADAKGSFAIMTGGELTNSLSGDNSIILGGSSNKVNADGAVLLGGTSNEVNGNSASLLGGVKNKIVSNYATIGGGYNNMGTGRFSMILGGSKSVAGGRHSFVIGSFGKAAGDYSGVINAAGSGGCEVTEDNTINLCADDVFITTPSQVIDLSRIGRRALREEENAEAREAELQTMRDEIYLLRAQVDALLSERE